MDQQTLMQMSMRSTGRRIVDELPADPNARIGSVITSKVRQIRTETTVIDVSGFATTTPIATTTFRQMVMLGSDQKIERVQCNLVYQTSATQDYRRRSVTGRWTMWLFQIQRGDQFVRLTNPKQVMDPRGEPFLLGSTCGRIEGGRPIYLRLDYEAATAPAGAVVFWDHADSLAMTITTS